MKHETILGQFLNGTEQRDAVHIAVAPTVAAENLVRGQKVGFCQNDNVYIGKCDTTIGIVDPFLKENHVPKGSKVWVYLYPNTIASLKHVWSHPAFDNKDNKREEAIEWMQNFANDVQISYEGVLNVGYNYNTYGQIFVQEGTDRARNICNPEIFWKNYHIITGEKVDDFDALPFSCSC